MRARSLDQLDDARRFRNASLYEEPAPIGEEDLGELFGEVERILGVLEAKLRDQYDPPS